MNRLNLADVTQYVEENIGTFHEKRINSLKSLKLKNVLERKNPYLYKAKYMEAPDLIIRSIVDAHISSNEETIFGNWLEGLAIFINGKVFGGWKSGISGIDLEFDKDGIRYVVTIKSSKNWANSKQVTQMKTNFKTAKQTLRTSNSNLHVRAINGCCYGRDTRPDKGDYYKYCGQEFWTFISGDENLYLDIIEPLGYKSRERNDEFQKSYNQMITLFIQQFIDEYCDEKGSINWEKIVRLNAEKHIKRIKKR